MSVSIYAVLPSAVRAATVIKNGKDIIDPNNASPIFSAGITPEASGLIAYLDVTAVPGTDTVQLVLEEQDPVSGTWAEITSTTATAVTGLVRMKVAPDTTAVAASTTRVQLVDTLPALWRLKVVHSAGSDFTYSLGVVLYK